MQSNFSGNNIIFLAIITFITLIATNGNAVVEKQLYVSPAGSDANPGTEDKPFQTIIKARDEVRKINRSMQGDIIVYLKGGTYFLDDTLLFNQKDSGSNGYSIVYKAYKDEKPVISGGRDIADFAPDTNGIHKSKAGDFDFRQLYIEGKRGIRARTPNVGSYSRLKTWDQADKKINIKQEDCPELKSAENVEIVIQMHWAECIMRIERIECSKDYSIIVKQPERDLIFRREYPHKDSDEPFYFENAYEFIDQCGEWYLNKKEKLLYYKHDNTQDITNIEVIAPRVETLVKIQGTLDEPVHDLHFVGLCFMHSTWLRPSSKGQIASQATQYNLENTTGDEQYIGRPTAAVYIAAAHDIKFERNIFKNLGATALDLHYGASDNSIIGNVFCDIAGNGISLAKFADPEVEHHTPYNPQDKREICRNNLISNNIITRVGQDYYGGIGIACGYAQAVTIEHNEIFKLPFGGIAVGWGWTDRDNAMRNNIIRYNHIHHVMQLLCDNAGIYTLSKQPGTHIFENYIHDIERSEWAVGSQVNGMFIDEFSDGITIEHNVMNEEIKAYRFHRIGTIVVKETAHTYDPDGKAIMKNAGLQDAYKDIAKLID